MAIVTTQAIAITDSHPSLISGINSGIIRFAFDGVTNNLYQYDNNKWVSLSHSYSVLSANAVLTFSARYNIYEVVAGASYNLPSVASVDVGLICEIINATNATVRVNYNPNDLYLIGNGENLAYFDLLPTEVLRVVFNGVNKWRTI